MRPPAATRARPAGRRRVLRVRFSGGRSVFPTMMTAPAPPRLEPMSGTGTRRHRSPVPAAVFFALLVLGVAVNVLMLRTHVWVDKGVAISFMAAWLGAWFLLEAVWDNVAAPDHWVRHGPRHVPLPLVLERSKRYWPVVAFAVGLVVGHVWWW